MQLATGTLIDREELRLEIIGTRDAFLALLKRMSEQQWSNRAPGSKWNGRQLMHHVTWALEQLPKELESAAQEKGMFNYPRVVAENGSYWLVKWESRRESRDSISRRYAVAADRVLARLAEARETDWEKGARFYGEGFYSVADPYRTPANHFREHCAVFGEG